MPGAERYHAAGRLTAGLAVVCLGLMVGGARAEVPVERVIFPAAEPGVVLVGYLFRAAGAAGPTPAVVMMHGRGGAYATDARGVYDASTLSERHRFWGQWWAAQGITALLVDGFGPRGYPSGFARGTYRDRPEAVSEVTARPGDAYAGLRYLGGRPDIDARRAVLQGFSNGGGATLAALADDGVAGQRLAPGAGFVAGLALYPNCGLHGRYDRRYRPVVPVLVLAGDADDEVSTPRCQRLVDRARAAGAPAGIVIYAGATHGFDDPSARRQRISANAEARAAAITEATRFVKQHVAP